MVSGSTGPFAVGHSSGVAALLLAVNTSFATKHSRLAQGAGMGDLGEFIDQVRACRAGAKSVETLVEGVKRALAPLLDPGALPPDLFQEALLDPVRLLLHRSEVVTVFAIASPPGFASKVHDHGGWGVVGQVSGVETEDVYRARTGEVEVEGENRRLIGLEHLSSARLHPGDLVCIVPPDRDIHEVRTSLSGPSVSLHAFVRDPLSHGFSYFEPRLYATHFYTGRYDDEGGSTLQS